MHLLQFDRLLKSVHAVQLVKKLYVGQIEVQAVLFREGHERHLLFENP
jgi:hypothetical protein